MYEVEIMYEIDIFEFDIYDLNLSYFVFWYVQHAGSQRHQTICAVTDIISVWGCED